MRPLLKINTVTNLQDARSSAAVGFDMISFDLVRGSMHKLSTSMIWNMVQWLSGPEIVLEMNAASLPELQDVEGVFTYQYLTLPLEEWDASLATQLADSSVILQVAPGTPVHLIQSQLALSPTLHVELALATAAEAANYEEILDRCLLHLGSVEEAEKAMREELVPWGYAFGREADEEPGLLDYERIDDMLEVYREVYGED